eukprot:CAMPEP_0185570334 /NCGR_PEP_ID=MMETSP0434-20130131/2680_1 /TAXON_ID=626734 ORGANISM="Favella taraikaensis, Strain Fe Narragansett Bay" /NCGR_SAMPLE_ID=MMETSP0434 /ASSEMBLY_ACC=CAM_ASM_000379 /LENGTH=75 /DNA_ID=CAMNT_0028185429 /DNA_START=705 /DNA_END=932 /DNA_ORIENTATION=-
MARLSSAALTTSARTTPTITTTTTMTHLCLLPKLHNSQSTESTTTITDTAVEQATPAKLTPKHKISWVRLREARA